MDFLVTEQQVKIISENISGKNFSNDLKAMYSFVIGVVRKAEKKYGLNLKLLTTWGPAVGGFMMPLDEYIKTGDFQLTDSQKALILVGVCFVIFYETKPIINKLIDKIKEENLASEFKQILNKAKQLKRVFTIFLQSLSLTINNVGEIISYSFLIPIVSDIQNFIMSNKNINETSILIVERMVSSGVILVSSVILTEIISKIIRRLS